MQPIPEISGSCLKVFSLTAQSVPHRNRHILVAYFACHGNSFVGIYENY